MKLSALATSLATLLLAAGCSSQAWYDGTRQSAENDCRSQPPASYNDCMARVNTLSYPDYERQRNSGR